MSRETVEAGIRELVKGLTHSQREGLGLQLAEVATGESVEFLRCDRGTMTAWMQPEAAAEKDRLLDLARRGQLDKDSEARLVLLLAAEKPKRGDGPLELTAADEERLRFLGHDPRIVARMNEVHSPEDYLRLKAEVEGGNDAA